MKRPAGGGGCRGPCPRPAIRWGAASPPVKVRRRRTGAGTPAAAVAGVTSSEKINGLKVTSSEKINGLKVTSI